MFRRSIVIRFWKLLVSTFMLVLSGVAASSVPLPQSGSSTGVTPQLQPVLSGLSSPVFVTNAKDGSNRLFILEQGGIIKVLQPGSTTPTVFLDITTKVLSGGERGLLGLAFHPQYLTNHRFFVYYIRKPDGAAVIAEYNVSAADSNVANLVESVILVIAEPNANHQGGTIEFGPDGFLYVAMGDGGVGPGSTNGAQKLDQLLGKMLRIDIDTPNGSVPYSSPSDNPYFGPTFGRDEIYAVGFRNPYRWSFDRATGQIFVADVGQSLREEIDIVTRGGNYGWSTFEGTLCIDSDTSHCSAGGFTAPVAEYDHSGGRCSIIGGHVYRGTQSTLPLGSYVYGDFCTGELFLLDHGVQTFLLGGAGNPSAFGEDEAGEIYVVGLGGTLSRIINTDTRTGSISASPNPIQVCDGSGLGVTTLTWQSTGTTNVQVRVGSPNGSEFASTGPSFSAPTGKWASQGMQFFLQDVSGGRPLTSLNTLAIVTVNLATNGCRTGSISANPNPIQVCDGSGLGATTLSWQSTGTTNVQVRVGSPSGSEFASTGPSFTAPTGKWVSQGMQFLLQDVSGGLPLTAANTLATTTVNLTTNGCPP